MNQLLKIPHSAFRTPHSPRRGISIIEVMTAIVVAMIGVFGIMVLIPFAVKQAESGLNKDAATALAKDGVEAFDVMGFRNSSRWSGGFADTSDSDAALVNYPAPNAFPTPAPVMIDPLWVLGNTDSIGSGVERKMRNNFGHFGEGTETDPDDANAVALYVPVPGGATPLTTNPFRGQVSPALPANLRIHRTSVIAGSGVSTAGVTKELARRLFQSTNELVFGEYKSEVGDDAGLSYPNQVFDRDGAGDILRRQSEGSLSWAAFIIPDTNNSDRYRRVTLVFVDRVTQLFTGPGQTNPDPSAVMASAMVDRQPGSAVDAFPSGLTRAGGAVVVGPVVWPGAGTPPAPVPTQTYQSVTGDASVRGVKRDDWVMMTNRRGAQQQIQFYRIVNVDPGNDGTSGPLELASLTLDGPDFYHELMPADYPDNPTYIVHLRGVINVYEQTISLEADSDWSFD